MKKIIEVEGFKAFRGVMKIGFSPATLRYIRGDWLYKPDTECWYCDGESYPDHICMIMEVEY